MGNAFASTGIFFASFAEAAASLDGLPAIPDTRLSGVDSYRSASFKTMGCQLAVRIELLRTTLGVGLR
jgi:hypothetical protein